MSTIERKYVGQFLPLTVGACLAASVIIFVVGPHTVNFGDAGDYMAAAQRVLDNQHYPRESSLPFFRPPFYPYFIAAVWILVPGSVLAVKLVQAILFGLTCWLLYRIGGLLYGENHQAALIGAMLYALNPLALLQVGDIQTESLHAFLVALGVYSLMIALRGDAVNHKWALFAGAAFGAASLCRPTAYPIGLLLSAGVIVIGHRIGNRADYYKSAGLMIAGIFLVISPWAISNRVATGEWILITDGGGYHLWLGNHPALIRFYEGGFDSRKEFDEYSNDYLQRRLPEEIMAGWDNAGGYKSLSLKQRESLWQRAALENMTTYPWLTLRLWIYKAWGFWRPWLSSNAYPKLMVVGSGVFLVFLYILAASGIILYGRTVQSLRLFAILAILFIGATIVHVITHVMMRFRLPYIDPYLCLFAGAPLCRASNGVLSWLRRGDTGRGTE
ncbi:MAG: glycosyltransferase family 39 protein [Acidobacteria bacterium]|nr:glycosyltransferase family 39 protein [Acidobacteriota bacterium]MCW5970262.1 glycosyltransferase family 39 protein [Blastocatellales bacterium]